MPIFEFQCDACGAAFEHFERAAGRPARDPACPHCGKRRVRRKLSVFSARAGQPTAGTAPTGGCARCGDPQGPCAID